MSHATEVVSTLCSNFNCCLCQPTPVVPGILVIFVIGYGRPEVTAVGIFAYAVEQILQQTGDWSEVIKLHCGEAIARVKACA